MSDYENAVADTSHVRGRRSRAGDTDAAASQFGGLLAPAQAVIDADALFRGAAVTRTGPPAAMPRALDTLHDRIESPPRKLHRAVEPWSSNVLLFASVACVALAKASLESSRDVLPGHERFVMPTVLASSSGETVEDL